MPGPLDFLTTPLVPEAPVRRLQERMDAPTLDRSPWEARLRGFGAGALEGLRGQTSPMALAGMLPLVGGAMRAPGAAQGLSRAAQGLSRAMPAFEVVEDAPAVAQAMPGMGAVDDMVGALKYNLAKIPGRAAPAAETLGQQVAEFTPQGGEAAYNATRTAMQRPPVDLAENGYQNILRKGRESMMGEAGKVTPEQLVLGGAGAGLAAYGAPKAWGALQGLGSSLQRFNPFQRRLVHYLSTR